MNKQKHNRMPTADCQGHANVGEKRGFQGRRERATGWIYPSGLDFCVVIFQHSMGFWVGWLVLGGISPGKTTPKIFSLHLFLWGLAGLCAHKAC